MREPMSIRVILKSGAEFTVRCETVQGDLIRGITFGGCSKNKPVFLREEEIAAMVRVMSDEKGV